MTVFKLDNTATYTAVNALKDRTIEWLVDNVNLQEYVQYVYLPSNWLRGPSHMITQRRQLFFKIRNEFVHQTGLHLSVNAMSTYKGKGWRVYAVSYVKIEEGDEWTVHSAEYDVFVKIFNDTKALQYKLAVL
jgi:hypothetical protein